MSKTDNTSTGDNPREVEEAVKKAMEEARERIESIHLPSHWREAIDYLDENFAFFLTHVLNLGRPVWDSSQRTAAVGLPMGANMEDFIFMFNPTFAALLEPEELAFVAAHETLHVLLNHLKLLDTGKAKGRFLDPQKFNVAADCVINDYLVQQGFEPGRVGDFGMFGQKVVGYNCANSTVSAVYVDIPDELSEDDQGGEGDGGDGGALGKYLEGSGPGSITGGHDWLHDPEDAAKQSAAAEKIGADTPGVPQDVEDMRDDDGKPGAGPGSEAGAMRRFVESKGVSMRWAELLRQVNPDFFKSGGPRTRPSYHRTRRKLMGVIQGYPDMGVLPVEREPFHHKGETPSIVLFMDGSGSCSDWIQNFATLAKSVPPDKLHLRAWSFSTYAIPFDVHEENPKLASGGTAFSPCEEIIQKEVVPELGHYPSAVVMLTDGEGRFGNVKPPEQYANRWLWLLTHRGRYATNYGPRPGRDVMIEDFCEGMEGIRSVGSRGY
jgi:hypothetical protein